MMVVVAQGSARWRVLPLTVSGLTAEFLRPSAYDNPLQYREEEELPVDRMAHALGKG
jgi:hypothetical protein